MTVKICKLLEKSFAENESCKKNDVSLLVKVCVLRLRERKISKPVICSRVANRAIT